MNILEKYFGMTEEQRRCEAAETSRSLYQLCEFNGEIWLTYGGNLVCPSSMLKDEPVEAVEKMRDLYIGRI